jgi:hypothetical protein
VIWKLVEQFRQRGNVNILKHVCQLTVVIESHIAKVSDNYTQVIADACTTTRNVIR